MEVTCQCGHINFKTSLPAPLALYICHCLECRLQSSSAFGASAIFPRPDLPTSMFSQLGTFTRPAKAGLMTCYFCKGCGSRIWHEREGVEMASIKGGLVKGLDWDTAVHLWTKRAVVPIPEGVVSWEEEPLESDA